MELPKLTTGDRQLDRAFRIALGDVSGNIVLFQDGLLTEAAPVILAGLDYDTPWTRDAAINAWNGASLLWPAASRNTLLAVLERQGDRVYIGGQYWDAIIWAVGAWQHYLYTGDRELLKLALVATRNSLERLERTEFDSALNLFRGPGVYGDGVAAYPDVYARTRRGSSSILEWIRPEGALELPGVGLPMMALSTNCIYYQAYRLAGQMSAELGEPPDPTWATKAYQLKQSINQHFWDEQAGHYRYLVDPFGGNEAQEGLGHALALLFGVANQSQAQQILRRQHITPHGIACLWPSFERYDTPDGQGFGRHAGTVWPPVQSLWASAAARAGRYDLWEFELKQLADHACRDGQFAELYHPRTGQIYGGRQEFAPTEPADWQAEWLIKPSEGPLGGPTEWRAGYRQSWSATGYLRLILHDLIGLDFEPTGLTLRPYLPPGIEEVRLDGLHYRSTRLNISIRRGGRDCRINGQPQAEAFIRADSQGELEVEIL